MSQFPQAPFSQPNFNAVMTALLQPIVDQQNVTFSIPNLYNLDIAVGSQLDTVGEWIGPTRFVEVPISGVFFSFDIVGLGFDEGVWAPTGTASVLTALPDDEYRLLLYSTIAQNHWDGTVPDGEAALNQFWNPLGFSQYIIDHQDMTVAFLLVGPVPNALLGAMYQNGLFDLRAAGVGVTARYFAEGANGVPFTPLFGFDVSNAFIAGFDEGEWATTTFVPSAALFMSGTIRELSDAANAQAYLPASSTLSGAIPESPDVVKSFNTSAAGSAAIRESSDAVVSASTGSTYATLTGAAREQTDSVASKGGSMSVGSGAILERHDATLAQGAAISSGTAPIPEGVDAADAAATVT